MLDLKNKQIIAFTTSKTAGKIILFFVIWAALISIPFYIFGKNIDDLGIPYSTFLNELIPLVAIVLSVWLITKLIEKENWRGIGFSIKNMSKNLFVGFLLGTGWIACCAVVLLIFADSSLSLNWNLSWLNILIFFTAVTMNAAMQEIMISGFIFFIIQKYSVKLAFLITAIVFTLLHPGAIQSGPIAIFNVLGAGLLFVSLRHKTGSLWMGIAAHTAWNFVGAVRFGEDKLGDYYQSLKLISIKHYTSITGGSTGGIEEGLIVTISLVIICGALVMHRKLTRSFI